MRVVLSDKARADLFGIHQYLEEKSPNAANAFIRRIDANFENLTRFPFIGRERSSLSPGLCCLVVGLHLVLYIVGVGEIIVVRVIDGRMDVAEEFQR